MSDLSFARFFRLRSGGIECDAHGLRVGGVALLALNAKDAWTRRDEGDLNRELSKLYGLPLDLERKRRGVDAVAAALNKGELARAQIAALLLQLPDPPRLPPRAANLATWKIGASPLSSPPAGCEKRTPTGTTSPRELARRRTPAAAVGRSVEWHAQTEKGFRGLQKIADGPGFGNVSVIYDPN
jgi:hypothetical protein